MKSMFGLFDDRYCSNTAIRDNTLEIRNKISKRSQVFEFRRRVLLNKIAGLQTNTVFEVYHIIIAKRRRSLISIFNNGRSPFNHRFTKKSIPKRLPFYKKVNSQTAQVFYKTNFFPLHKDFVLS